MPLIAVLRCAVLFFGFVLARDASALCTLVCSCTATTTGIVFPTYNPLSSGNVDSVGNVRVACGGVVGLGIPYTVTLSAGTSGSMSNRQMAAGAARLSYNLFISNGYSTVWGDGSGATGTVSGGFALDVAGLAPPQDNTVYGRIPGNQMTVAPGVYADTLVVTLTYY